MFIWRLGRATTAAAMILVSMQHVHAQPLRYRVCTTGFSVYGIVDGLPVYDRSGDQIGASSDLWIDREGTAVFLEFDREGIFSGVSNVPWPEVEIGETWIRALGPARDAPPPEQHSLVSSAALIGSFVRTAPDQGLTRFGVVDDLIINVDTVAAVVIRPDLGLGFANKYAVPFELVAMRDHDLAQPGFDLMFDDDEVRDIGAFAC